MPEEQVYRRFRAMTEREAVADDGSIELLASTSDAVDFGAYREVLIHTPDSIDMSAARALLINHDPNQIAGTIADMRVAGGMLTSNAKISADARLQSGISVREAVKSGALRGVSIGYTYSREHATYDEKTRTITVSKWRLLEETLTPIPADARAMVRSLPEWAKPVDFIEVRGQPIQVASVLTTNDGALIATSTVTAAPAASQERSAMSEPVKPATPAAQPQVIAPAADESTRAAEIAAARQRSADVVQITKLAESHGLRASEYLDAAKFPSLDKAIDGMIAAKAAREATSPQIASRPAEITREGADKARDAAVDSVLGLYGAAKETPNAERGFSTLDIARRYAQRMGHNVSDWNRADCAAFILGKPVPGQRAANVTSSNFNTVVLASIQDKAVFNGFNIAPVTYPIWTKRRPVMDFKQFSAGALDSGNLVSTAEDVAFPELTKAEGSYSASLGLWGATISLTYQALVNDDLGEFMSMLNRAGAIANRTIDKQVYTVLNAATFTGNVTSGITGLSTAGSLDAVRAAFEKKTGPAGEILGNNPKFLLVPSCIRTTALQQTRQIQPGSEAYPTTVLTNTDLTPVVSPHLTQAATASQSTFYLAGDPLLVDTMIVAFLQGAETPIVMEYDSGAVACRKWKIMQAFVAALATTTVSSTIYIPGMQQGIT